MTAASADEHAIALAVHAEKLETLEADLSAIQSVCEELRHGQAELLKQIMGVDKQGALTAQKLTIYISIAAAVGGLIGHALGIAARMLIGK